MNYKPLGSRLIVKILESKEVEVAGMKLSVAKGVNKFGKASHEWESNTLFAQVIKRGDGVTDVEENDVVVISGLAGHWLDKDLHASDWNTHRVIDESDILCIDIDQTEKLRAIAPKETANAA